MPEIRQNVGPASATGVGRRRFIAAAGCSAAALFCSNGAMAAALGGVTLESGRRLAPARGSGDWRAMIARHARQNRHAALPQTQTDDIGEAKWCRILYRLRGEKAVRKISLVQNACNAGPYRTDIASYGRNDYWATPREFFRRGGDCEDFAAAKYLALAECGIGHARLRLVIGRLARTGRIHSVTTVAVDGEIYVLDNNRQVPVRAADYRGFQPLYSLSDTSLWLHTPSRERR